MKRWKSDQPGNPHPPIFIVQLMSILPCLNVCFDLATEDHITGKKEDNKFLRTKNYLDYLFLDLETFLPKILSHKVLDFRR